MIVFLGDIFGPDLLVVVIVIAVLIFGGAAIPKLARNLGSEDRIRKGSERRQELGVYAGYRRERDEGTRVRQVVLGGHH